MVDRLSEVLSRPDGRNILEDGRFAELVDEGVTQTTGVCGGVIAAVAQKYSNGANSVLPTRPHANAGVTAPGGNRCGTSGSGCDRTNTAPRTALSGGRSQIRLRRVRRTTGR